MRDITLTGLGVSTSCLGFGCASLGSRVSAAQGTRALARAHEAGVRWFDVAPAYGAGAAEAILGEFLVSRRDGVQICTKVGLLPPSQGWAKQMARKVLRPAVAAAGPVRRLIRKSGATANQSVPLTPELLRDTLERSLRQLKTDYVDVYALHNADPADLAREEILRTLEDLQQTGKTRALAVAGDNTAARAAIAQGAPFALVQLSQAAAGEDLRAAAQAAEIGVVTHTVFGVGGELAHLSTRLAQDPALAAELASVGYDGPPESAAGALLMARAFARNPRGVVLASMFSERSLTQNLRLAERPLDPATEALCAQIGL